MMKNNLQEIRWEKGFTVDELAILSKVSKATISSLENSNQNDVYLSTAYKLAKALDVDIFQLFVIE